MRISQASWEKLGEWLSIGQFTLPPKAVYLLVHTLLADAEVEASYGENQSNDSSTTWRNWLLTRSVLIHTDVEYAAPGYDHAAEAQASPGNPSRNYLEPTVHQAWARPLDSVTSLQIGSVGQISGLRADRYPVGAARLTFADGSAIALPSHGAQLPEFAAEACGVFLTAVIARLHSRVSPPA
jgi:hypothetical protein